MNVTIRPLQESDAYTSWRWRNDPEVFRNRGNRYGSYVTLQNELDWIHTVLSRQNEYRFAIIADGCYIGNTYLTDVEAGEGTIGIFIGNKNCWNKQVGFKAYMLLLDYAFTNLQLQSVRSTVRNENHASNRLHKKTGFKPIGQDDEFIRD